MRLRVLQDFSAFSTSQRPFTIHSPLQIGKPGPRSHCKRDSRAWAFHPHSPNTISAMQTDWQLQERRDDHQVHRRGPDLRITLTRARKANVLTLELVKALTAIYQNAAQDASIFRVLLTAEGKISCAGMDLNAKGGVLDPNQAAKQEQWNLLQGLFEAIDRCPKVTLALVNGPAFGAGCGLIFVCDIRIATESATFNISEAKVGLAPAVVMKWILREWGVARGREAMLTARPVGARELADAGVIHSVVRDVAGLESAAEKYIQLLNACGPEAQASIKEITRMPEHERDEKIKEAYDRMMNPTPEARYGVKSFHGKQRPNWIKFYSGSKPKM